MSTRIVPTLVAFVYSSSEAGSVLQFIKNNPHHKYIILAPTIAAQLVLKSHKIYAQHYYDLIYKEKGDYYQTTLVKHYRQARRLVNQLRANAPKCDIEGINLVDVLQIMFESEFLEVVNAKYLYTKIRAVWKPDFFLFPKNLTADTSGWEATFFSPAAIIHDFLAPQNKISYFTVTSSKFFERLRVDLVKKVPFYAYLLINRAKLSIKQPKKINFKDSQQGDEFLMFSGGINLYYYDSLFKALKTNKSTWQYLVVSAKNSVFDELTLRSSHIDYRIIDEYLGDREKQKLKVAYAQVEDYISRFKKIKADSLFIRSVAGDTKKALIARSILAMEKYSRKFARQIVLAQSIVQKSRPRLVITTHDPGPSALPFVYAAKIKKIPTLLFLHGLHDVKSTGADHESDKIVVWGEAIKKEFAAVLGKKHSTINSAGFPYLDGIFWRRDTHWQSPLLKNIHFHKPLRLAFLLTAYQLDKAAITQFMFEVFAVVANTDLNCELWIRTHPGQPLVGIEKLARFYRVKHKFNEHMTISWFSKNCDIVVSWDTTALVWPMIYGKPLFYTTPWWGKGHIPVEKYRAGWSINSAKQLMKKVSKLQKNLKLVNEIRPGQKKFLHDFLGYLDGSAGERHVGVIEKYR